MMRHTGAGTTVSGARKDVRLPIESALIRGRRGSRGRSDGDRRNDEDEPRTVENEHAVGQGWVPKTSISDETTAEISKELSRVRDNTSSKEVRKMLRRRRRPVLRAAALAGGGAALYHAGKRSEANAVHEEMQDAEITQELQQQTMPAPPATPAAGGLSEDAIAKLQQLGQLHEQGVLTDEEFATQKAQVLGG
jgi:hypothetical protein